VLTASPEELRLLLIDGAIRFARQGAEALTSRDWESAFTGISNCRNIITELLTSIRDEPNPELAANARSLYMFMFSELMSAGFEKSVPRIEKVIELLEYERETWVMLMQKLADERGSAEQASAAPSATPTHAPTPRRTPLSVQA
jgi:flagellar protein FliS